MNTNANTPIRHLSIKHENTTVHHPVWGQATQITTYIVDEQGNRLSDEEVHAAFNTLTADGFFVKRRFNEEFKLFPDAPGMGKVVQITSEVVYVMDIGNRVHAVPRADFHRLYQLD